MEISKTMDGLHKWGELTPEQENLRFELFDWLKEKGLSAQEACSVLALTKEAIHNAYLAESRKIML